MSGNPKTAPNVAAPVEQRVPDPVRVALSRRVKSMSLFHAGRSHIPAFIEADVKQSVRKNPTPFFPVIENVHTGDGIHRGRTSAVLAQNNFQ